MIAGYQLSTKRLGDLCKKLGKSEEAARAQKMYING
jgi:hypothetical protein